jgi:dihydrolipoamide dehydrogenase
MAKGRKVDIVRGYGTFLDPHHIEVEVTDGTGQDKTGAKKIIKFQKCIIAAGSAAVHLPFIPRDPRIVDSTGALELRFVPKKMLVIGGGIIGLEMATVYSTLGARVDVVEMMDGLMQGPDRDAVKVWEKQNASRFDKIMLKTKTVAVDAREDGLYVTFEGEGAPAEPVKYDMILQAAGRAERQEDRRRQGRRGGDRPRLHQRRRPDADQRAAHLRHRRPRRPADAGPQGGA